MPTLAGSCKKAVIAWRTGWMRHWSSGSGLSNRQQPEVSTEQLIERAVDRLLQNRTGLIIAHRLHTVHRADEILILEDGRLREHGERRQLLRDPESRFSQLLRTGQEAEAYGLTILEPETDGRKTLA